MCWLAFTDTRATCINFSVWGHIGYKQPPLFLNFWSPISPKLIEVGIEIWYAGGCVGSKTRVATTDQLTIANC